MSLTWSATNESCRQPQILEYLSAADILKLQNLVVLQNKVDIIQEDQARNQYKEIREFLKVSLSWRISNLVFKHFAKNEILS